MSAGGASGSTSGAAGAVVVGAVGGWVAPGGLAGPTGLVGAAGLVVPDGRGGAAGLVVADGLTGAEGPVAPGGLVVTAEARGPVEGDDWVAPGGRGGIELAAADPGWASRDRCLREVKE